MWNVPVHIIIKSHLTSNHCADLDVDATHLQRCRTLANNLPKFSDTYDGRAAGLRALLAFLVWQGPAYSTQKSSKKQQLLQIDSIFLTSSPC